MTRNEIILLAHRSLINKTFACIYGLNGNINRALNLYYWSFVQLEEIVNSYENQINKDIFKEYSDVMISIFCMEIEKIGSGEINMLNWAYREIAGALCKEHEEIHDFFKKYTS